MPEILAARVGMPLITLLLSCGFFVGSPAMAAEAGTGWRAGVARARITPLEPMWLSGYGSREHPSEGTRLELWAKALALADQAGTQALILTFDLVGLDRDTAERIRHAIEKSTGIPPSRIALCSSHTHTGPVVGRNLSTMYFFGTNEQSKVDRYTAQLTSEAVRIGTEAVAALGPARLSWSVGRETVGVNRRNNPEPLVTAHRAGGSLRGPVDYDVPVLRVAANDGKIIALLFGYACHATVLSDYQWSGDYPGFAQQTLEQRHPGAQALFIAGCGADVNPLPRRTPELAQNYGQRIADAVDRVLEGVLTPIAPTLKIRYSEVAIPFDTLPTRPALEKAAASNDKYAASHAKQMLRHLDQHGSLPQSYPYPLALWRLGQELDWVSLGGEVVVDYSLRLKQEWGPKTWVSAYTHDVMAYIPSRRVWEEGGYEGGASMMYYGLPTRWTGEVENRIFEALRTLR